MAVSQYQWGSPLQASYALGYNLAIEYLADFEKTWMLDSFRHLDRAVLQPQGRRLTEWLFLEVWASLVWTLTAHRLRKAILQLICGDLTSGFVMAPLLAPCISC